MIRRILAWLTPQPEPPWQYDWHTLTRKADGRTEQLVTTGWSEDWEPVEMEK